MAELLLISRSVTEIRTVLRTDDGVPVDLSLVTEAAISFRPDALAVAEALTFSTAGANLDIDVATGSLVAMLTQAEANALEPGVLIGDAAIYEPLVGWIHTMPFTVRILPGISPHVVTP